MSEAYLATTRKRVSLARHARLMDYHLHEGNQASTWLALEVRDGPGAVHARRSRSSWCGPARDAAARESVFFASREHWLPPAERQRFDPLRQPAAPAHVAQRAAGAARRQHQRRPRAAWPAWRRRPRPTRCATWCATAVLRQLLIAERLNPLTGRAPGRNPRKRQLLRLLSGRPIAGRVDPRPGDNTWVVRVHWRDEDALRLDYSFTTFCAIAGDRPTGRGRVDVLRQPRCRCTRAGRWRCDFHEPGTVLAGRHGGSEASVLRASRSRTATGCDWVLAALPEGPLAYLPTPPGGEVPARSTLRVEVDAAGRRRRSVGRGGEPRAQRRAPPSRATTSWSRPTSAGAACCASATGPTAACCRTARSCTRSYQIGGGQAGNVGADQLVARSAADRRARRRRRRGVEPVRRRPTAAIPSRPRRVRRNAPEAFRARQLRAVTLADYVRRAEEVPGVSRAVARYAWTGSWRTVRVDRSIRSGTTVLDGRAARATSPRTSKRCA